MPFRRVDVWAERQPQARWARLTVRDGERGPLRVDAMAVRVRTKLDCRNGLEERKRITDHAPSKGSDPPVGLAAISGSIARVGVPSGPGQRQ